jgi:dTDP-4-amino-4,6-dideoxygalactose transaminase
VSSNYRLTNLQGTILGTQLEKCKKQTLKKMEGGKYLGGLLKQIGGIQGLPEDERITRRGYYYYLMRFCQEEFNGLHREDFLKAVQAEGVGMGHAYGRPIHKYPLFQTMKVAPKYTKSNYKKLSLPNSEAVMEGVLVSLGHPTLLASKEMLAKVAEAVQKVKDNADVIKAAKKAGKF